METVRARGRLSLVSGLIVRVTPVVAIGRADDESPAPHFDAALVALLVAGTLS